MCHPVHTIYHIVYLNPICRRWNQVERLKHGIPQESCSVHRHWWCREVSEWWWWFKVNVLKDWPLSSLPVGPSYCSREFLPRLEFGQSSLFNIQNDTFDFSASCFQAVDLNKGPSSFEEVGPSKWSVIQILCDLQGMMVVLLGCPLCKVLAHLDDLLQK